MAFSGFGSRLGSAVIACSLVMGFAGISPAHADAEKIGVVDMQKALQTVDAGKKAKSQLEKEVEGKKKEFDAEKSAINKMGEEFKKQSLVMSDEARAKKQGEIQERIMKLQEKGAKTEQELHMREQELTQPILVRLRTVISDIAKKKGYHMILEKSENTVLFSEDADDLTQDVITTFNSAKSG